MKFHKDDVYVILFHGSKQSKKLVNLCVAHITLVSLANPNYIFHMDCELTAYKITLDLPSLTHFLFL